MYTKKERLEIVLDIVKKLKHFKGQNNQTADLYKPEYSYYEEFKEITNKYINEEGKQSLTGTIIFFEVGCTIEYSFPYRRNKPLFVLKKRKY